MGVFAMPSLGADMEDGTLVEWTVAEGDTVARGDVIAVVETQKGAIEVECFEAGVISEILIDVGQVAPVGAPLAMIGNGDSPELPEPTPPEVPVSPPSTEPPLSVPELPDESPVEFPDPRPPEAPELPPEGSLPSSFDSPSSAQAPLAGILNASPAARARAQELGIELHGIQGTGPEGVIVLEDVERTQPASDVQQALGPSGRDPKAEMRKAIAAAMVRSKQTIPHFYLTQTIDVQPAQEHLAALNKDRPPSDRLLLGALLVRATALAVKDCPSLNGHYTDDAFHPSTDVNVGLAIALRGGGLVAPALMQADTLELEETMAAMRDLVGRARTGRLRGQEMTAGTITLSSLGDKGAEAMSGVIFPPQVALVGLGSPKLRPWVVDGAVQARSLIHLTLSVDHRANDGRQASRFIAAFESHLQTPEDL